jgi:hypothetical protein
MRHRRHQFGGAYYFMPHRSSTIQWSILLYTPEKYFCGARILNVPENTILPTIGFPSSALVRKLHKVISSIYAQFLV